MAIAPKVNQEVVTSIEEMKALGFEEASSEEKHRLIVSVSARAKFGKTHFSLTAPEPIIFFDLDFGTEGVISKFKRQGKKILVYSVRVPKGTAQNKEVFVKIWEDTSERLKKAWGLSHGTIVCDTSTELWEIVRLARFGKVTQVMPHHYTEVNKELREFIRLAYASDMNTIFIHKLKKLYVGDKWAGDYEISGWGDIEYNTMANIILNREETTPGQLPLFSATVKDSRHNPALDGVAFKGPMCSFETILEAVLAKQDEEE